MNIINIYLPAEDNSNGRNQERINAWVHQVGYGTIFSWSKRRDYQSSRAYVVCNEIASKRNDTKCLTDDPYRTIDTVIAMEMVNWTRQEYQALIMLQE